MNRHTSPLNSPLTAAAASLAFAAVLGLSACGSDSDPAKDPSSPASSAPTSSASASATTTPSETTAVTPTDTPAATSSGIVYFVGQADSGPKLFGLQTPVATDAPADLAQAVAGVPSDPDLHSVWPADSVLGATVEGKKAVVDVTEVAVGAPDGADAAQAQLGLQQVVWTLHESAGVKSVTFTVDGKPATTVLGEDVAAPVKLADFWDVINQVRIDTPAEGAEVSGSFTATGANSSFEAWVGWKLLDAQGKQVKDGFSTAEGWGEKLYPWKLQVSLEGVTPGTYTFVVHNDDPSGGEGGSAPDQDTRTIIVK